MYWYTNAMSRIQYKCLEPGHLNFTKENMAYIMKHIFSYK